MNHAIDMRGTSYGTFYNPSSLEQEVTGGWSVFNDLTSPCTSGARTSLFDAVSTLCGLSIGVSAAPQATVDALLPEEVPLALAEVRDALSLNTVELSKVFNVSRRAIYDWIEGKNVAAQNRQRLNEVHQIAQHWQSYELGSLGSVVREEWGGCSLLNLLSAEVLDRVAITSLLDQVAARLARAKDENAVPTAEELLKLHGMSPLSGQAYRRNVKTSKPRRR